MPQPHGGSLQILDAVMAAFNAHDLDGIMAHLTADCVFDTAAGAGAGGTRLQGADAVRAAFAARFAGIPDVHYAADRQWVSDGLGVSEWTMTGTSVDGTAVEVRGTDHWEFRGELISRKDAYLKHRDTSA